MKRKLEKGMPLSIDAADFEFLEDTGEYFFDAIIREEEVRVANDKARDILKRSKSLSPKQRKYIRARFIKGRSVLEIAEMNKITPQGINASIKQGLEKLRTEFAIT